MSIVNSLTTLKGDLVFTDPGWMFAETLGLLEQTRDCVVRSFDLYMSTETASLFAVESSRLTARLTTMMSWLLARRAVASGEIDFETARRDFRLNDQAMCRIDNSDTLPPALSDLQSLLRQSLSLYRRIAALDAAFDQPAQIYTGRLLVRAC